MPLGSKFMNYPENFYKMATYKRNKSGGSQSEGASNSASPASSVALSNPSSIQGTNNNAPKYGTLVPNRIFVGGISSNTTEAELCQLFSKYGNVKATKIIADRAGVSKGYGFVTFESEEEVKFLIQDANNIVLKERRLNIAPAIKKQPFSRSFDASSPPPSTPNVYFHNGMPYTYHNGMAFFHTPTHQPALAALPSADPSMYPSYGHTQSSAPHPYGAPVLLPAPPPVFMPQNYPYQPLPMSNGANTQFFYTSSASSNSSPGSPMAGTPENPHLPSPLPPHYYAQQYPPHEAYFPQSFYMYYSITSGEYEAPDPQANNDDCSSTVSTPHSDISERSSNRSPANIMGQSQCVMLRNKVNPVSTSNETASNTEQMNKTEQTQPTTESQVPVVSWQNLKNIAEERELYIRDGRRAFHPVPPPPPPQPMLLYQQPPFPPSYPTHNAMFQPPKQNQSVDITRGQRQSFRVRPKCAVSPNNIPFIPKFPASFNNNNPLVMNNNYHERKQADVSNGRPQRFMNNRGRGNNRGSRYSSPNRYTSHSGYTSPNRYTSPPPSSPKPTNSYVSCPSPQIMQQPQSQILDRQYGTVDRSIIVSNTAPRWSSNQSIPAHQMKRIANSKRQNGSTNNMGVSNNTNNIRVTKKPIENQESVEVVGDMGGGGDAQPLLPLALTPPSSPSNAANNSDITPKLQTLSLGNSS